MRRFCGIYRERRLEKRNKTTGKRRLVIGFGREIAQIKPRRVSCLVFLA